MSDYIILVSPAYVLSFVISSIYGLGFFVLAGQGWRRMALYWGVAVAAFFTGQAIAKAVGLSLFNIGAVNLAEGTFVSALSLLVVKEWKR